MAYNWFSPKNVTTRKAYAYYRHSAEDRQENSIPLQREQIYEYATKHEISIIKEFQDAGKSGLTNERVGFQNMLSSVRNKEDKVHFILVLDVSRWGRFQDVDESAMYTWECKKHNVKVCYVDRDNLENEDLNLTDSLLISIDRTMAAIYSKNLSEKVFKGCKKIAEQGFRAGGPAPYGLKRVLLDEKRNYLQDLNPGQRKSIQNQRVTLAPGPSHEVRVIKEIYRKFIVHKHSLKAIADSLNKRDIPSPFGLKWTPSTIGRRLQNALYTGTMVYNKTFNRLKCSSRKNPHSEWVITPNSFKGIIDENQFKEAQKIIAERREAEQQKYSMQSMSENLRCILLKYGSISTKIMQAQKDLVSVYSYRKIFGSLEKAYQYLYQDRIEQCRAEVIRKIISFGVQVYDFNDFIVLDNYSSIHIQPRVLKPSGFEASWLFNPLRKEQIDLTLGVLLNSDPDYEVLGYLAFPANVRGEKNLTFSTHDLSKFDLFTYSLEEIINCMRKSRSNNE